MNIRIHKSIYFYLVLTLIFTSILQITHLDSVVTWSKNNNYDLNSTSFGKKNALTDEEKAALHVNDFLILFNPKIEDSVKLKNNIEQVIKYMKKKVRSESVEEFDGQINDYRMVIITFSELDNLANIDWIDTYVHEGGNIFFAILQSTEDDFYKIYRKLGIYEIGSYKTVTNMKFHSNILLGLKDEELNEEGFENIALKVSLEDRSKIHISSEGIPLLWETSYGKGKFIVFNGTICVEKTSRGLISGALSLIPDYIYPILNMKLVYIDDFPAPFPLGFNKKIYDQYNMSNHQFFKEIWWPDMLSFAKRYNLKYTAGAIETYNNQINPPFTQTADSDISNLIIFGRELIKSGGELGLHGYNHQSFVTDQETADYFGYNVWKSKEDMTQAVDALKKYVESVFPKYQLQTYIPPSNVLNPEGREAIKKGLPDLKNISSIYLDDLTHNAYVQEYEVSKDGIVELPRITSGFISDVYFKWAMINAVNSIGVFSHFIHPDDVIDEKRGSNLSWKELKNQFNNYLSFTENQFGWLRSLTASEASAEVKKYMMAEIYFEQKPDQIRGYINHFTDDMYFILRTEKSITTERNCRSERIGEDAYLIHATNEKFEIGLKVSTP